MISLKKKQKSFTVSMLITLFIVAVLVISGPAEAVSVIISGLQTASYKQGSNVNFTISVNITDPDKYVPVTNISIDVTGPENLKRTFALDGTPISGDPTITIMPVSVPQSNQFGYGYGYGVDSRSGTGHTFGYGYGYGYGYGAGGGTITYKYNATINTTFLPTGTYNAVANLNTGTAIKPAFTSAPATFTISAATIQVIIDVAPKVINLKTDREIKVTIYNNASEGFDIDNINISTMVFGPFGATSAWNNSADEKLMLWFNTKAAGIECGYTQVTLTGNTYSGQDIFGSANITAVGCGGGGGSSGGSSSGGGGGGGGAIGSGEPFDNIDIYETRDEYLMADHPVTFRFSKEGHRITEIVITGKESESDVSIRVEELKGKSRLVDVPIPGAKYMNILVNTKKIKEALIRFKVENSWIASGGISSDDVKMYSWDGKKWDQLETTITSKDASYTYFEAKTYHFSPFAIAVSKEEMAEQLETTPWPESASAVTETPEAIGAPPKKAPSRDLGIIVGIVVLIGTVAVVYIKRKEIFKR